VIRPTLGSTRTTEESNYASTNDEPGDDRSGGDDRTTRAEQSNRKRRRAGRDDRPCSTESEPDQRLQCLRRHACSLSQEVRRDGRAFVAVGAWRDAPFFTDSERAALALAESVTRLNDRPDPVPDEIWDAAARHFDEPALAALILSIALINVWNRLNVSTRQVAGEWVKSAEAQTWMESGQ